MIPRVSRRKTRTTIERSVANQLSARPSLCSYFLRMSTVKAWDDSLPEQGRRAWQQAAQGEREQAIVHATQFLDTLSYKGEKLRPDQTLSWPRSGVFRDDGAPIAGIPPEIKETTALVASFILAKIPFDVPAVAWVMLKVGHLLKQEIDPRVPPTHWH